MPELTLQRIPFTADADNMLRSLKAKTGITPNILCRIGLCLSLEEQGTPEKLPTDYQHVREIGRYTLLGKHDKLFVALLIARLMQDKISYEETDDMFLAHINRGVEILSARVKSINDLGTL